MSDATLRIAIVGAESTGKTTLASALGAALAQRTGQRVAIVAEWLREWCDAAGRTPRPEEQAAILRQQQEHIDAAAERHAIVVADATGLMVAVYSRLLFGDASLEAEAVAWHHRVGVTLLTALDLPWVSDGYIRDGPHVREPVDSALRELLSRNALPYHVVGGAGEARLAQALAALQPALRGLDASAGAGDARKADGPASIAVAGAGRPGLLTGLAVASPPDDERGAGSLRTQRWTCDCCWPEGERASLASLVRRR